MELEGELRCRACGERYAQNGPAAPINMLREADANRFRIDPTESVSDHPYDGNAAALIEQNAQAGTMVLDCGAGVKSASHKNLVQLEVVPYEHIDVLAVNQRLPFADGAFGAVFSLDVLEHVSDPFACAREIARVLAPGGVLYLDLPFLQPEHGFPHHYFNATRAGAVQLFEGLLAPERHYVPISGHPFIALYLFVNSYWRGLPEAAQAEFAELRISDLVTQSSDHWMDRPFVADLAESSKWELACTTQGFFRKPGGSASDQ